MEQKTVIRNEVTAWVKEGRIKLFRKNGYMKTMVVLISSVISAVRGRDEEE